MRSLRQAACWAWTVFIALTVVTLEVSPSNAADVSIDDLLGRWCGNQSDYTFSREQLTVKFVPGGQTRVLGIARVESAGEKISVYWTPENPKNFTSFIFTTDRQLLVQLANKGGDEGPERKFFKCKPVPQ